MIDWPAVRLKWQWIMRRFLPLIAPESKSTYGFIGQRIRKLTVGAAKEGFRPSPVITNDSALPTELLRRTVLGCDAFGYAGSVPLMGRAPIGKGKRGACRPMQPLT